MIVEPKIRGFVCTTAHPDGCAKNVEEQIDFVKGKGALEGAKNVLVIGASTGYGLASRITAMIGLKANTLGIFYEKASNGRRTATAGWYNTVAFEEEARNAGLYATSINGDAFSHEIKTQTIDRIKEDMGMIDLVVYSLASPRRIDPDTGQKYHSVLKPIGEAFRSKSIDVMKGLITQAVIEPATEQEIFETTKVMGGEDWQLWMEKLAEADVLAQGVKTVAYSYIGPDITLAMYREGTIGKAKEHLEMTAKKITKKLVDFKGEVYVAVAKALVTQASAAIPVVPLYMAALYKVMKKKGTHEGCIEQINRIFRDFLYNEKRVLDSEGRIRTDNFEMDEATQKEAIALFTHVTTETLEEDIHIQAYQDEFYKLFGFGVEGVDYQQDCEIIRNILSIKE